jgi:ribonuclease Z
MEKFEVTILGCGSALPTTRHMASSQVVNIREKLFMIDCGEGTQTQLRRTHLRFNKLNHIFISHLHGDHCFGLIGMISTFDLLGRTAPLHIYGPTDTKAILQPQIDYFCKGMAYPVEIHEINPKEHACIYDDRSLSVWTLPLKHRIPCCGFLFSEKPTLPHIKRDMIEVYHIPTYAIRDIKEGADWETEDGTIVPNARLTTPADPGRSYAYCSDTLYKPSLTELVKDVTVLYHEATFAQEHAARAKQTYHTTAIQAATLAQTCGAGRLCIGHFSSRYETEDILLKEAQSVFKSTFLAKEGLTFEV